MTQDELDVLLSAHELWVASGHTEGTRLFLYNAQVSGLSFSGRTLNDANVIQSNLTGTQHENTNWTQASFDHSTIDDSIFSEATLDNLYFVECSAKDVDFSDAHGGHFRMETSDFTDSNFTGAELMNGSMANSNFTDCIFDSADFSGTDFSGAINPPV